MCVLVNQGNVYALFSQMSPARLPIIGCHSRFCIGTVEALSRPRFKFRETTQRVVLLSKQP